MAEELIDPDSQDNDKPAKFTFTGEPWQRQTSVGESPEAYEAFAKYRDMGRKRSLSKVGRELHKSTVLMARWSSRWQWVRRVEEYEKEQEREYQESLREQRREMAIRHAKQGAVLQTAALAALKKLFGERFENITAESMKAGDVLRFFTEGAKLERIALGEPAEIVEQQHTGGTADNDRKPFIPLTHAGRIDEALALLEAARVRAVNGADGSAD